MKKLISLMSILLCAMTAWAQASLHVSEDLPGTLENGQYSWTSEKITMPEGHNKLRVTFLENTNKSWLAGFPMVCIAEFYLYDKDGERVELNVERFSSNATQGNEGKMEAICNGFTTQQEGEGQYQWYWHSQWSGTPTPYGYHYLEVNLADIEADLSEYSIGWVTRQQDGSPTEIVISTGATSNDACKNANSEMLPTLSTENKCIFYTIKSVRSKNYLTYTSNNVKPVQQSSVTENGYWYFTEGVTSGKVVMRNFATEQVFGENLNMMYGGEWFIVPAIYRPGCILAKNANDLTGNCIDDQGSGTAIGTWKHIEGDNEGTSWLFEPLAELDNAKENAKLILKKQGAGYPAAGSNARTALEAAMNADDATAESIYAAIATYKATYDEASEVANIALPEAGKIYRIVSAHSGFAKRGVKKAIYSNRLCMNWKNYDTNDMSQLWAVQSFESGDTKTIKLTNINDAMHPQKSDFSGIVKMHHTINEGSWEYLGEGQFRIKANKLQGLHANNHSNGSGGEGNIINYNTGKNEASAWYLEEVDATAAMHTQLADNVDATYVQSYLIKNTSNELKAAVNAVKNASDEERSTAFANLLNTMNNTEINYIDEGYFYMKSKGAGHYAYYNDENNLYAKEEKTLNSIFKLTKASEGTFYIQANNGYYAQGVTARNVAITLNTSKTEYRIEHLAASDHYVLIKKDETDTYNYWHQATSNSNKVVGWTTTDADNTLWAFEPLTNEELDKIYTSEITTLNAINPTITYNNDSYTGNKDIKQTGGFYMLDAAPNENDFTVTPAAEAPFINVFSVNGKNLSLNIGYNGENVFTMRCVKDNSYARYHSECQLSESDATNMLTFENNKCYWESLFWIEKGTGDYEGFYTIRPLAAWDKYVYNLGTADANSKVAIKEAPTDGVLTGEYYWKISSFGEYAGNITPYHEGRDTGDAYGWNKRGGYGGKNHIGYWLGGNSKDDNKWYVKTMEQEFTPHTLDNSVLGYATYESVEEHLPYTKAVTEDGLEKLKAGKYDVVLPTIGAYYTLKNEKSDKFMTGNKENITIEESAKDVESIFYVDEGYSLMSYFAGRYLDTKAKGYSDIGTKLNGKFSKVYGGYKENTLAYYNNDNRWTYGGGDTGGISNGLDQGSADEVPNNTGYNWVFTKVTSLPVTITEAGYASFYAPVAVELPDGVTAHTITINTELRTARLSEGFTKIPANTGVILAGAPNTYSLKIIDEQVTLEGENILEGTVATEYITEESYVLANPTDENGNPKGIGLYLAKTEGQTEPTFLNNSHKAYLPKSVVPTVAQMSAGFRFSFGGTTDIEEVKTESENVKAIYDLTGRKLESIAGPGIYIINGKKVIVR